MEELKSIRPEAFASLDFSTVTLLDLREPDEVLVSGIQGAINIPFSEIGKKLDAVPKDRPVYVFCRTGDWSEEVTELLLDRGMMHGTWRAATKRSLPCSGKQSLFTLMPQD